METDPGVGDCIGRSGGGGVERPHAPGDTNGGRGYDDRSSESLPTADDSGGGVPVPKVGRVGGGEARPSRWWLAIGRPPAAFEEDVDEARFDWTVGGRSYMGLNTG